MRVGMLWYDDRAVPLADKVERAAAHYAEKYGQRPTLCYVHPSALPFGRDIAEAGIEIKGTNMVLPYHFWLGDTRPEPQEAA